MKVAVHQPNYLPWLGFFRKMQECDVFVLLDTVQFERRGRTHRTQVLGHDRHPTWISQHVSKRGVQEQIISQTRFADQHWVHKHLNTLRAVYGRASCFREVFPHLDRTMAMQTDSLVEFNAALILMFARELRIPTRIEFASRLAIGPVETATERIAKLVRAVGGNAYLSGEGARAYNQEREFRRYGIELSYTAFAPEPYSQNSPVFVPNLSVVDAALNIGFDATAGLVAGQAPRLVASRHNTNPVPRMLPRCFAIAGSGK